MEKLLRNKGMKKTFDKVAEVIRDVMNRTMCVLEEPLQFGKEEKQRKVSFMPFVNFLSPVFS